MNNRAVTFPSIYTYYYEYIKSTRTSVDLWPKYKVFIYILKEFSNLITSSLPCKKYGRILYCTNCDPFLMLAHSLECKKVKVKEKESFCEQMRPVMRHLNKKVHDLGDKLCSQNDEMTDVNFDLESFICQVDSEMWWESFSILTQSRTERKRTDTHLQKRRLITAYLLSVILFDTTAGHCKFPFHVILSDFVEANSGSAQLITVLHRLGAVASKS